MTKATACLIALAVAGLAAAPATAAETKLSAHLGGAGSADTDGAGHANFRVDAEKNLLLVKGAVPGHAGADVVVRPTVK